VTNTVAGVLCVGIWQSFSVQWLEYNPKSKKYFIGSFDKIRKLHHFEKRSAARCVVTNIKSLEDFFIGAIISKSINTQKFLRINKSKKWAAVNKRNAAFKPTWRSSEEKPEYYGLSNSIIAKLLGCKQTRACQLKQRAAENGFIEVSHRYFVLATLDAPDKLMREQLYHLHPKLRGRVSFRKTEEGKVEVVEQLYDEISPIVKLTTIRKLGKIKNAA
jgi:hypothetical protein